MNLKTLYDADIKGKTVIYRSPYDIDPILEDNELVVKDTARIKATLPTLEYLLEQECKIVVLTYVDRPDGKVVERLRTDPHAKALADLLGVPVKKADDCVGQEVQDAVKNMEKREVLMLENTRFHPEEMEDDDQFAEELASLGEVVVFDGFPQAHRHHASVTGIMRHLSSYAGFYVEREVNALHTLLQQVKKPFAVIIGGAKISDKIETIENLYENVDIFLVGGGVANLFLKAEGKNMGDSYVEDVYVDQAEDQEKNLTDYAQELMRKEEKEPQFEVSFDMSLHKVQNPRDLVIADDLKEPKHVETSTAYRKTDVVPEGWAALDIGRETQTLFSEIIAQSKTIFWNGPMGKVEDKRFERGTRAIIDAMTEADGTTVIAGGDTVALLNDYEELDQFTHVSLAGGATMEFLAGKKLPALEMLRDTSE